MERKVEILYKKMIGRLSVDFSELKLALMTGTAEAECTLDGIIEELSEVLSGLASPSVMCW